MRSIWAPPLASRRRDSRHSEVSAALCGGGGPGVGAGGGGGAAVQSPRPQGPGRDRGRDRTEPRVGPRGAAREPASTGQDTSVREEVEILEKAAVLTAE